MLKLPVERGRGQRDLVFEAVDARQRIGLRVFGMVITHSDAFAAINAALVDNMRPPAAHAYGLRGAALEAVGAALALILVQTDGVESSLVHRNKSSKTKNRPYFTRNAI